MAEQIKLKDLARLLGVSVSTVARSLSDSPGISAATKARVQRLAREKGYVAHSAARAMRTGHSHLIGLIVPDVRNDFYGTAAMALARRCEGAGFQLLLAATQDDPASELRQVRGLVEARAAGMVTALSPEPRPETLALLGNVPTVELIREGAGGGRPWLGIDERAGLEDATRHLLGLGHRRIAYVGGLESLSTGRQRLSGYRDAFATAGQPLPADLVRTGPPDAEFGTAAMRDLLALDDRPTGVVTAGAELTVGVLEAIGSAGLPVPAAISVVGFGDAPWFRWWGPGLTTIALPVYDMALGCGDLLMRLIAERAEPRTEAPSAPLRVMHRPTLLVRASTAAPPRPRAVRHG